MATEELYPHGLFGKLGRREARTPEDGICLDSTRSACPECLQKLPDEIKLIDADIYVKDNKVYMRKFCPEHGFSTSLVSSDVNWYTQVYKIDMLRPGTPVLNCHTEVKEGCPYDCGICSQHHQHSCAPIVDITDACDMECTICSVRNTGTYWMSIEKWKDIVDMCIKTEGEVPIISLTGGEPTLHPKFFEMARLANERDEISRVDAITNGMKIAKNEAFVEGLAKNDIYVSLQFDGLKSESYVRHRGKDYLDIKLKALENLKKYGVGTAIQMCVSKYNIDQVGETIMKFIKEPYIRMFIFQPLVLAGVGGEVFNADPMDRITIPDVVHAIEEQTSGLLNEEDFKALPCAHADCQAVAYLHISKKTGRMRSLARIMDKSTFLDIIKNEPFIRPEVMQSEAEKKHLDIAVMDKSKDNGASCSCAGSMAVPKELRDSGEEENKAVFIHHFMDAYTFDLSRLKRCCNFYILPNEKMMPVCYYNLFQRHRDPRWRSSFGL